MLGSVAVHGVRATDPSRKFARRGSLSTSPSGQTISPGHSRTGSEIHTAIEVFFKWIKQHLRIKSFYGYPENAIKTQIWIAVSVYVLVALVKKKLHAPVSLYTFLQVIGVTIFEKSPILQVFHHSSPNMEIPQHANQLNLFGI